MNKKFLLATAVTLLLGTTSVMADNHHRDDGPRKPHKEVVHKSDKKDKVARDNRHFDAKKKHHAPKPKPVVHKVPKHKPVAHVRHNPSKPMLKPACAPCGRHGKSCNNSHCCYRNHCHHSRPLPPARPIKKQVRITPPFSPIQVTVRI